MTGPDHYRKAEELTEKAGEYLGQGDGQESAAIWAAVAQIHATLALAAATALGTTASEGRAWADLTGTKFSEAVPRFQPSCRLLRVELSSLACCWRSCRTLARDTRVSLDRPLSTSV
jgi:hypothetical protein